MRIVVLDDFHHAYAGSAGIARLREQHEVAIYTDPPASREDLLARLRGVPIVLANRERTRFTADLLAALPDLELLCNTGNHLYHVDVPAATAAGVAICLARETTTETAGYSTAELTLALMLALLRHVAAADRAMRQGAWPLLQGQVLYGKTLGILGLGRVGRQVARLASAFGMRLLAWGPTLTPERAAAAGAAYRALDDLLAEADVVSIHLTLSEQSRGLIDAARLRRMRPSAYLINTARGAIVDEAALVQALRAGWIAGAALDVFGEEPLPAEHPLRQLDNVVLTPHLGWPTDQTYQIFADAAARQITAYLAGDYSGLVNPEALAVRQRRA